MTRSEDLALLTIILNGEVKEKRTHPLNMTAQFQLLEQTIKLYKCTDLYNYNKDSFYYYFLVYPKLYHVPNLLVHLSSASKLVKTGIDAVLRQMYYANDRKLVIKTPKQDFKIEKFQIIEWGRE